MLGLSFIKNIIIDNSTIINKDLEKGNNTDLKYEPKEVIIPTNYYGNITIKTDCYDKHPSDVFIDVL